MKLSPGPLLHRSGARADTLSDARTLWEDVRFRVRKMRLRQGATPTGDRPEEDG